MTSEDSLFDPKTEYPISIVHDGDHGGDDLITSLMALARSDAFDLLGITTCFGNIPVEVATRNACRALDFKAGTEVSVYQGSSRPWKSQTRSGDNAFGSNGLGGVELSSPVSPPSSTPAIDWLIDLLSSTETPVTLCPTGPLTNMARLLEQRPDLDSKIERMVAMGGCLHPLPPGNRQGNITPYAEFNFYMDAEAADFVLNCGIPIVLFPMDVTHELVFTKSRQQMAREALGTGIGEKLIQVMQATEQLDNPKFDLEGSVFHDESVLIYLLHPELYEGKRMKLEVVTDGQSERYGQLQQKADATAIEANVLLIDTLHDSEKAFDLILDALKKILKR